MSSSLFRSILIAAVWLGLTVTSEGQIQPLAGVTEVRLSGWCRDVPDKTTVTASLGDFRVRKGGSLFATGTRQTILVESGGQAEVTGTASTVYVANGGKATIGGERSQVYAEKGGNVVFIGRVNMKLVDGFEIVVHRNSSECQ
jgi:hypothetical protein